MENKTNCSKIKINCVESNIIDGDKAKIDKGEMNFFETMQKVMQEEMKKHGINLDVLGPFTTTTVHPCEEVDVNSLRTRIKDHYIKEANDLMKTNFLDTCCYILVCKKHESIIPSLMDYWQEKKFGVKRKKGIFISQDVDCIKIKLSWK